MHSTWWGVVGGVALCVMGVATRAHADDAIVPEAAPRSVEEAPVAAEEVAAPARPARIEEQADLRGPAAEPRRSAVFHLGGGTGAAIGVVVPAAVAAVSYLVDRNNPTIPIIALVATPLTAAIGAFVALSFEVGLKRAVVPALVAGASVPVGGLALGVVGGAAGALVGLVTTVVLLGGLPAGDWGTFGVALLTFGGGLIGAGTGVTLGAVGLPFALAATLPDRLENAE